MIRPMLAKASDGIPSGAFTFELKWDGVRGIALVRSGRVELQSRSGKSEFSARFARVAAELATLPDCVLDGELVRLDALGHTAGLGSGLGPNDGSYVVFDLLELDGHNLRNHAIEVRRRLLGELLTARPLMAIAPSPVFDDGEALLDWVGEHGLEGIVAKRSGSLYREGGRTEAWQKVKVRPEQEFVVGGWTDGKGSRSGRLGGLMLGYYDRGELVFAGRAGARLDDERELRARMTPRQTSPFGAIPTEYRSRRDLHWVEPDAVVQVAFQRWTDDGALWHPICKGLRDDKPAHEVVKET